MIFDIQRFSLNDGDGIRTTVFMKGCPLRCAWCHNPESHRTQAELMLDVKKCIGCGECAKACANHVWDAGRHTIRREMCTACGKCADRCPGDALTISGKIMTADEVCREALKDAMFFREKGGVTLSGGEPLSQPKFLLEILRKLRDRHIHTAIETSGFAPWEVLEEVSQYTDLFLFDVKETDAARHKAYTGADNALILENLRKLDALGAHIRLRCPIVPGYNDREEHLIAIGKLADTLRNAERVEIEPYHPLGRTKSEQLGRSYAPGDLSFPNAESIREWLRILRSATTKPVIRA